MAGVIGPTLDRSGDPWIGVFPGLGTVRVHLDGAIVVQVEADQPDQPEEYGLREGALRHGWAEPLAFVRQGYQCAWGSALAPPDGRGCLVVTGTTHDVSIVLLELVTDGWSVLADHLVPTRWVDGSPIAFVRSAPVLVSRRRADRLDKEGVAVRQRSDAVRIDAARTPSPQSIRAFVGVSGRRPNEVILEELSGHDRFIAASQVMVGGVMRLDRTNEATPPGLMREHLALAKLPFARLRFEDATLGADVAELCRWWSTTVMSDVEAS